MNPSIPSWVSERLGGGYDNVTICYACENRNMADYRPSIFLSLPVECRTIIHEPVLEWVGIRKYLATGLIEQVTCGGKSDPEVKICGYIWILEIMQQCVRYNVPFWLKRTSTKFKKENRVYHIERKDQMRQAEKAGVNYRYERNN